IFADWSTNFFPGDGTVLVSRERPQGLWQIHEIQFQNRPDGRLGHFILAFGQDADGEMYILTSDNLGPTGETGRIYQLAPPGNRPGNR
ncbi:MAG TPA: hypothetical protein VK879_20295, partial [Candidatus Sulfomarinibacteraceae bacterium]|nr:hypothetical protein [Candidatus Sulfomarinibacteraceae bacterium]